jgi:hypothetical protein
MLIGIIGGAENAAREKIIQLIAEHTKGLLIVSDHLSPFKKTLDINTIRTHARRPCDENDSISYLGDFDSLNMYELANSYLNNGKEEVNLYSVLYNMYDAASIVHPQSVLYNHLNFFKRSGYGLTNNIDLVLPSLQFKEEIQLLTQLNNGEVNFCKEVKFISKQKNIEEKIREAPEIYRVRGGLATPSSNENVDLPSEQPSRRLQANYTNNTEGALYEIQDKQSVSPVEPVLSTKEETLFDCEIDEATFKEVTSKPIEKEQKIPGITLIKLVTRGHKDKEIESYIFNKVEDSDLLNFNVVHMEASQLYSTLRGCVPEVDTWKKQIEAMFTV